MSKQLWFSNPSQFCPNKWEELPANFKNLCSWREESTVSAQVASCLVPVIFAFLYVMSPGFLSRALRCLCASGVCENGGC